MRIDHVMLPVDNLERSIAFYTDVFQMTVVAQREDGSRRFAHVGYAPRGEAPTLELIENRNVTPVAGGGHFCICLPGLENWIRSQELAGRPFALPHGSREGRVQRVWIRDPDGHLVEVLEAN